MSAIVKKTPLVPSTWEEVSSLATYIFQSGLCPDTIKTPQQAAIVILAGTELGIGPMMSFRELYPVHGQVGMSTKLMCSLVRRAGHDYEINERTPERCKTTLIVNGKRHEMTLTMEQARAARWHQSYDKETKQWKDKPMWVSCPDLMLMYRCLSRNIRANDPDAIMLMSAKDELEDNRPDDMTINGTARIVEDPEPKPAPAPAPEQPKAAPATEAPKAEQAPGNGSNGQAPKGAAWTTDEGKIKALHAWINEVLQKRAVNLTWETIKEKALHVKHLAEFTGKYDEAQRAILALVADVLKAAGNPEQASVTGVGK